MDAVASGLSIEDF